jgi:hypothetical protein
MQFKEWYIQPTDGYASVTGPPAEQNRWVLWQRDKLMDGWVANEWTYNRKATYTYADAKSKHFGGQAGK